MTIQGWAFCEPNAVEAMNRSHRLRGSVPELSRVSQAFLRLIRIPILMAVWSLAFDTRAAGLSLSAELVAAGPTLRIVMQGTAGKSLRLESSGTLDAWQSRAVLENPTGTVTFVDPDFPAAALQFYRAVELESPVINVTIDASPGGSFEFRAIFPRACRVNCSSDSGARMPR